MNNSQPPPPPPPPPHGSNARSTNGSGLPPGNYDIFVIPPHSSGGGFLYLPSLHPHRNSFLAGFACALLAVGIWQAVSPMLKQWTSHLVASGGQGVVLLIVAIGVAGWALGRTQTEKTGGSGATEGAAGGGSSQGPSPGSGQYQQQQNYHQSEQSRPPPKPSWGNPNAGAGAQSAWEKAREETRRREEDRKRAEELKKKQEETNKKKEEADKAAKAAAEKEKWEQMRAREKEAREREARERLVKERLEKLKKDAEAKKNGASPGAPPMTPPRFGVGEKTDPYAGSNVSPSKQYQKPSAKSFLGTDLDGGADEHSYRPYDARRAHKPTHSASSHVSESPSFYSSAPSHSTAHTSPPPSHRGPYSTKDPDKIVIKAVYLFNNMFAKPVAQLISGIGSVTDGLILRITTEGCFVDDDVRGVGQREWDVKAWGMKLVETGSNGQTHILRATLRDTEGKRYVFILSEAESWKVTVGLQRLRRGSQVRSLGVNGMQATEVKKTLDLLGW